MIYVVIPRESGASMNKKIALLRNEVLPSFVLLLGLFTALPSEALDLKSTTDFQVKCATCHSILRTNVAGEDWI